MNPSSDQEPNLHRQIVSDLQTIVRAGLPLRMISSTSAALSLRGVTARAADKKDPASLVAALEGVMRLQLAQLPDPKGRLAAQCLFGATNESSNRTLTDRRKQAAKAAGYELHHFRKRVEPRLIASAASALIADSESYNRNRAIAPGLMLETRRPGLLPQDAWAWEAIEHEESLLRLWSAVYGLRSELLALERLVSMNASPMNLRKTADKATWQAATLIGLAGQYQAAYGDTLVQSDSEVSPQDFLGLAGWTPTLTPFERNLLASIATDNDENEFVGAVQLTTKGRNLLARWRRELCRRPPIQEGTSRSTMNGSS